MSATVDLECARVDRLTEAERFLETAKKAYWAAPSENTACFCYWRLGQLQAAFRYAGIGEEL